MDSKVAADPRSFGLEGHMAGIAAVEIGTYRSIDPRLDVPAQRVAHVKVLAGNPQAHGRFKLVPCALGSSASRTLGRAPARLHIGRSAALDDARRPAGRTFYGRPIFKSIERRRSAAIARKRTIAVRSGGRLFLAPALDVRWDAHRLAVFGNGPASDIDA